jgi:hypothetical protein
MNDLIQSLPSPHLQRENYSHMDRGVMDGRWSDVGDGGDEDLLQIPIPAGCQNRVSGSESRFFMAATQRKSIWEKHRLPDIIISGGICRREERLRGLLGPPHARAARPGLGRATCVARHLCVRAPRASYLSHLLAPWVFWWNRIFDDFSWIFTESWISAQKWDTRAILLKTASVRVSCIQNTQIKRETIAKVFRKVDTFWTYQVPPCPMTWNKPISKWQDKQIMNTSTSLLFTICLAFYFEMRHRMSTMGMLQISTMNYAWLRLVA